MPLINVLINMLIKSPTLAWGSLTKVGELISSTCWTVFECIQLIIFRSIWYSVQSSLALLKIFVIDPYGFSISGHSMTSQNHEVRIAIFRKLISYLMYHFPRIRTCNCESHSLELDVEDYPHLVLKAMCIPAKKLRHSRFNVTKFTYKRESVNRSHLITH